MKKIYLLISLIMSMMACQKGEMVSSYQEFSEVLFSEPLPSGMQIYRNGDVLTISGQQRVKTPMGEATYTFVDGTGTVLLEQMLAFDKRRDTVSFIEDGEASYVLRSLADVAVNPARIKLDIANLSAFTEGNPVNIQAYKVDNLTLAPLGEPETMSNVSSVFTHNFYELDLGGYAALPVAEVGNYAILLYLVDREGQPYRINGYPVAYFFFS